MKLSLRVVAAAAAVLLALPAAAQKGHFTFTGPMSGVLAEGVSPGKVTGGLPFSISLSAAAATVQPTTLEVKGAGWSAPAVLSFDNSKYTGGVLTADLHLKNGSGAVLEGLRLDITGATEEYRDKDAQGSEVLKTRPQNVSLASPLLFGDLAKDEDSVTIPIRVTGVVFTPDTTKVTVTGVLSGMRVAAQWKTDGVISPAQLDADGKGRLYFADVGNEAVTRMDADGTGSTVVGKLPGQQCVGASVNPKTGAVVASCMNLKSLFKYTPGGADDGKIEPDENQVTGYVHLLRFDPTGTSLHGAADGGAIYVWKHDKFVKGITKIGDFDIATTEFDVASDGTVYDISSQSVLRLAPDGVTGKRIASGNDWHLGRVYEPVSVRAAQGGTFYVAEAGNNNDEMYEYSRISQWDASGKQIRVFGFGGKAPQAEGYLPGQVQYPIDMAMLPDGRLAVAGKEGSGNSSTVVTLFAPF